MFKKGPIDGVHIKPLAFFEDDRGWLSELLREDDIKDELNDASIMPTMCYISMTRPGIARGPHEHAQQTDYFAFISSTFKLVLWDRREGSPTYNNRIVKFCGERNPCYAVVPPGVVHAYKNVGISDGTVINFPNRLFAGWGKKEPIDEIRYEHDPGTPYRVDE